MRYPVTVLAATMLVLAASLPAFADRGHGVRAHVWIGPVWGPVWPRAYVYPYPYPYPYPYSYPYSYYEEPRVIEDEPVYVQPPMPQGGEQTYYWYYCRKPAGYYPYVQACPDGWTRVTPTPPDTKESK